MGTELDALLKKMRGEATGRGGTLIERPFAVVSCPQCGRWGLVVEADSELHALWADPKVGMWLDTRVGSLLADGELGCGFDGDSARAAWDGTRYMHYMMQGRDAVYAGSDIVKRPLKTSP